MQNSGHHERLSFLTWGERTVRNREGKIKAVVLGVG